MRLVSRTLVPFEEQEFAVILTGDEVLHLYALSHIKEGGDEFTIHDRWTKKLERTISEAKGMCLPDAESMLESLMAKRRLQIAKGEAPRFGDHE